MASRELFGKTSILLRKVAEYFVSLGGKVGGSFLLETQEG